VWRDTDCEAEECEYNQRKVPIFVSRVYERRTCLRKESISSSFCLIWARRYSRLLKDENEHSSSSGEEVEGEGARETTQSSILRRTAAGSSETERPCEHCDGQSHFLKRQITSRLCALSLQDLQFTARRQHRSVAFFTQIEGRIRGSGHVAITIFTFSVTPENMVAVPRIISGQAFCPSRTCLSRDPVEYRMYSLPTHIIKGCVKRCVALLPDQIVALVPSQIPWSLWARIWHLSHAPAYNGTSR
jgi:hypothetical protein